MIVSSLQLPVRPFSARAFKKLSSYVLGLGNPSSLSLAAYSSRSRKTP